VLASAWIAVPVHAQPAPVEPVIPEAQSAPVEPVIPEAQSAPVEPVDPEAPPASAESDARLEWSATVIGQGKVIAEREASDRVGGYFDQWEYTPNKSSGFPIELGVRDAAVDLFDAGDRPVFQLRLESPTSNLGISGPDVDQPFFNQRIDTRTRGLELGDHAEWALDLDYARIRTEELRRFPDTEGGTLLFDDQTDWDDRFFRDRTGFETELRRRSAPGLGGRADDAPGFVTEFAVRGGFQARDGLGQRRAHRDPVNDWLGLREGLDRNVSDVGGGVLVGGAHEGRWLVTMDFDHERLRWQSPRLLESDLGAPPPAATRPIGFVPDSDRFTSRVVASGRAGDSFTWNAAYGATVLEQAGEQTPDQVAADFGDNRVVTHSVAAGLRWRAASRLTLKARFAFDLRDNQIDRTSALFNPTGGVQIDPFVEEWRRIVLDTEAEWRFLPRNAASLGVRYSGLVREVDYAEPGGPRVLPENGLVGDATRTVEVYAKTRLRPVRALRIRGDLGYRAAPSTGYVTDLENYVHGRVDARYTLPTSRPFALTAFVRGDSGRNDDFDMVSGLGPDPAGPSLQRRFERWTLGWGLGADATPVDRLSVFASFICGRLRQESGVVTSSWQRYYQEVGTPPTSVLTFTDIGGDDFLDAQKSLILGVQHDWSDRVDSGVSYTFSHASAEYEGEGAPALDLARARRRVDQRSHVVDLEAGWRPAEGLRLLAGYRLQLNRDDVDAPQSVASAAAPIDRSTHQHTFTLGASFDGRFFERD